MTTPEKKVKDKVRKLLKEHGVYNFMPATHGYGRSGVPDIIACFDGRFMAIETKAGKGTTTTLQERELALIRQSGGVAMVINEENIHELEQYLASFDEEGRG